MNIDSKLPILVAAITSSLLVLRISEILALATKEDVEKVRKVGLGSLKV